MWKGVPVTEQTFAIVIPARLASSRLARKVLLKDTGKYLIEHVWERLAPLAGQGHVSDVIIATDSDEVRQAAASFGAHVQMTRPDHPSGTDRVAEVAAALEDVSVIVNVQGDEPETSPDDIQRLMDAFRQDPGLPMATLARRRTSAEDHNNPNIVKVVTGQHGQALYFSRAPIPYPREGTTDWLHHIGIYAYRRDLLLKLSALAPTPLEAVEKLEQLRVLAHGHAIRVVLTENAYEGIDTRPQYDKFVQRYLNPDES